MIKVSATSMIRWLRALEDTILVTLLMSMLLLAITQIGLRNFYDSGIIWGDALLRVLVLWVGLIGAMVASRQGDHINIDLITRFVQPRLNAVISFISSLATTIIAALLAYHSYRFVLLEYEDGLIAFAGVPNWACEVILPIAFSIIALRYLGLSYIALTQPFTKSESSP